jgi:hypothetical protein
MKKPAKKAAKTKPVAKAAAKKSAKKPAPKAKAAKPVDGGRRQGPESPAAKSNVGTYKPQPIQGIGWAPFRYPLS